MTSEITLKLELTSTDHRTFTGFEMTEIDGGLDEIAHLPRIHYGLIVVKNSGTFVNATALDAAGVEVQYLRHSMTWGRMKFYRIAGDVRTELNRRVNEKPYSPVSTRRQNVAIALIGLS